MTTDEIRRAACEACLLLNEAVRELVIPHQIHALTEKLEDGPINIQYLGAVRHTALTSVVIHLWRLHETRKNFLVPWLFTDAELKALGLPTLDEFLGPGKVKFLEIVRHQYAGHPTAKGAKGGVPGEIIAPEVLGYALREIGLTRSAAFLDRVQCEIVPGVEKVRNEIVRRFPEAETYMKETYPIALEGALHRTAVSSRHDIEGPSNG